MSSVSADAVADLEDVARRVYARAGRESTLAREATVDYLFGGLRSLPAGFTSLDASRAWMVYWCVHGLALLGVDVASRDEGAGPPQGPIHARGAAGEVAPAGRGRKRKI